MYLTSGGRIEFQIKTQQCTRMQTSIPGRCLKGSLEAEAGADETSTELSVEARLPTVSAVDAAPPRTPRVVEYTRAQFGRPLLLLLLPDAVEAFDKSRPMSPIPPLIAFLAIILADIVTCTTLADVIRHCCAPNGADMRAVLWSTAHPNALSRSRATRNGATGCRSGSEIRSY